MVCWSKHSAGGDGRAHYVVGDACTSTPEAQHCGPPVSGKGEWGSSAVVLKKSSHRRYSSSRGGQARSWRVR